MAEARSRRNPGRAFKLRKSDQIGAAGAEEDQEFLAHCFVDTGDLALLENMRDHRILLLGRTGTGKTALLHELATKHSDRVIPIRPSALALTYVANSTILNFFANLGVNLDPFFTLLWRHVITVEILSRHFQQHPPATAQGGTLLDWLKARFVGTSRRDKEMSQAVKYLEEWGKTFWQETEFRVKEITQKVESELSNNLGAELQNSVLSLQAGTTSAQKLTADEKAELVTRGQEVVSKAQVRDLHTVCKLLDDVLDDRQKHYYVVIDGLDENWVEERLRYRLIMALIGTAKEFVSAKNAKIIIALRRDLIDRVFRLARDAGFQEEKYQSLHLPLVWTKGQILDLLDRRVQHMVARRYTKQRVSFRDLLPTKVDGVEIDDFVFSLATKPRDVIALFNTCILAAIDEPKLTQHKLKIAEGEFSRSRLRALADEWSGDYPDLLEFAKVLERRPSSFKIAALSDAAIEDIALEVVAANPAGTGVLFETARAVVDGHLPAEQFKFTMLHIFYKVGLVGLKIHVEGTASWRDEIGQAVSPSQLTGETSVVINPTYRRALGVPDK